MVKIDKSIRKIHNIPRECDERYLTLDNEGGRVLSQAGICYAGISKLVMGYQVCVGVPIKRHMVIFTNAGHGYIAHRQYEYRVKAGDIITVPAGTEVIYGVEGAKWNIVWFYLTPIERWQQLQARGIWSEHSDAIQRIDTVMEWTMEELQALSHSAGDINLADKYSELLLTLLTDSFGITPGAEYENEINVRLNDMLSVVQNSLNCKWSLADMASEIKLTPITLQRMIKKRFNTTAHQLLISLRMRQAEIILRNSEYPLKIIAEQVGYSDEFSFASAFKSIHSIAPGTYRRRLHEKYL